MRHLSVRPSTTSPPEESFQPRRSCSPSPLPVHSWIHSLSHTHMHTHSLVTDVFYITPACSLELSPPRQGQSSEVLRLIQHHYLFSQVEYRRPENGQALSLMAPLPSVQKFTLATGFFWINESHHHLPCQAGLFFGGEHCKQDKRKRINKITVCVTEDLFSPPFSFRQTWYQKLTF